MGRWTEGSSKAALSLFTDDDHAAAGVPGRIDAEHIITWFLVGIARARDDFVTACAARDGGLAVALVPGRREAGAIDMQALFSFFDLGLGRCGTSSHGQDGQDEQNTFHSCP